MKNLKNLAFILFLAFVNSVSAFAYDFVVDGIFYKIISEADLSCEVTSDSYKKSYSGEVVIPPTVFYGKTYNVIRIGEYAFRECKELISVKIPNSVTEICGAAFSGCTGLTSISIPNSVKKIENGAFSGCKSLPIENGYRYADNYLVEVVNKNEFNYTLKEGTKWIGAWAFERCSEMETFTIPNSVISVGSGAFDKCENLKSLTVGSGVQEFNFYSGDLPNLFKLIVLPNTRPKGLDLCGKINYVASDNYTSNYFDHLIKKYDYLSSIFEVDGLIYVPVSPSEKTCAVIDCTYDMEIEEIIIGETVKYKGVEMKVVEVNPYLLAKNDYIKSVVLPKTSTEIPDYLTYSCVNLEKFIVSEGKKEDTFKDNTIVIPSRIKKIGNGVFDNCSLLTHLLVKDGKETLTLGNNSHSKGLFDDCPLKDVVIGRNLSYNTSSSDGYSPFYRNLHIESVELTDIPTEVFANEFYGCTSLKSVTIGDGVSKIGDYAFYGCTSIETFTFGKNMKEIGEEAFSDCSNMTVLYAEPILPPKCGVQALDDINKWNCKLYVPGAAKPKYQAADQWKAFFFMEAHNF